MDAVLRAIVVYGLLLLLFRLSGKRSLSQITTFDLLLLLIVSEATQQALLGDDFSITNAAIVIVTLVALDRALDTLSAASPRLDRVLNSAPIILIEDGEPHLERMKKLRVTQRDILEQARSAQGVERLDQIKYAVLERNGAISVIPNPG